MSIASEAMFYPAPPVIEVPAEIPTPKRPLGPFGQFLDNFGNRLVYSYDSTTSTARISLSSDVELDTTVSRSIKRRSEENMLLGLDDDSLLMDSSKTWEIFDQNELESKKRQKREREDLDLLGIDS
jgi:hypothetical protein